MGGRVIDKDWRSGTSAMEILVDAVRRCGDEQCYWMCREVVRICCPRAVEAAYNQDTVWGFIGSVQYGVLPRHGVAGDGRYVWTPAYQPRLANWNSSAVVHILHRAVADYARLTGATRTAKNRQNRANALICDVVRDVFPENPALLLRKETRRHGEFTTKSTSFMLDKMPGPIFADWLQDQGEDDAANHLRANKTGATPYWLSSTVLWWEDQPVVSLEPIVERLAQHAAKRKNVYQKGAR